jgi:hypothetical protein
MRAMARVAQAMAMATNRVIARKRVMASDDNNKTIATDTTTTIKMTISTNTMMMMMTLTIR